MPTKRATEHGIPKALDCPHLYVVRSTINEFAKICSSAAEKIFAQFKTEAG
jgi:hypothetical protein